MNGGIINSITRLHLFGYFYWVIKTVHFLSHSSPLEGVFAFKPEGRAGALWKLSELLNYVFSINLLPLIPSTISLLQFLQL